MNDARTFVCLSIYVLWGLKNGEERRNISPGNAESETENAILTHVDTSMDTLIRIEDVKQSKINTGITYKEMKTYNFGDKKRVKNEDTLL